MKKTVVELFAGVGGFRVGFNNITSFNKKGIAKENGNFEFVWSNQWEPSTKTQHAFDCYNLRFPDAVKNSNVDISKVDKKTIPDHTILCGGFPCQDYSVAHTLSKSKGIEGKKGVLWWQINEILKEKRPPFILLENVDRLVKSPAKQRGRDFGIMLRCLSDLGYALEWRIINAADYGHPQRRRRIYLFGFHKTTYLYKKIEQLNVPDVFKKEGIFVKQFPIENFKDNSIKEYDFVSKYKDLVKVSDSFKASFENAGFMIKNKVYTVKTKPIIARQLTLSKIVQSNVDSHYFLNENQKSKFKYLRGNKKLPRIDKNTGHKYFYSEGAMSPYDSLDLPGRTMLTSEGTTNRSTHIIKDKSNNKLRLLTPIECERLNQFPDDWTNSGMPEKRRYFMMGNALVCGIIKKLAIEINEIIEEENDIGEFDRAYAEYLKNPKTYTVDEVITDLKLK